MELLTPRSRFEPRDQDAAEPVAVSARIVQAMAVAVALAVGAVAWSTPDIGALATVIVVLAIAVAACAQWPERR